MNRKNDLPEQIWTDPNGADWESGRFSVKRYFLVAGGEYIRADLYDAAISRAKEAEAEVKRLREALTHIDSIDPQDRQMAGVSDHAARGLINAAGAIARDALHKGATNEPQD